MDRLKNFNPYQEWEYKNVVYTVRETIRMKSIETGEWYNAIVYENPYGEKFAREANDFLEKFKLVNTGVNNANVRL